jgi:hypothetical protein
MNLGKQTKCGRDYGESHVRPLLLDVLFRGHHPRKDDIGDVPMIKITRRLIFQVMAGAVLFIIALSSMIAKAQPPSGSNLWQPIELINPTRSSASTVDATIVYSAWDADVQYYTTRAVTLTSGDMAIWVGDKLTSTNVPELIPHLNTNNAFPSGGVVYATEAVTVPFPVILSDPSVPQLNGVDGGICLETVLPPSPNPSPTMDDCLSTYGSGEIEGTSFDDPYVNYYSGSAGWSQNCGDALLTDCGLTPAEALLEKPEETATDQQILDAFFPDPSYGCTLYGDCGDQEPPSQSLFDNTLFDYDNDSYNQVTPISVVTTTLNNEYDADPNSVITTTTDPGTGTGAGANNGGGDPNAGSTSSGSSNIDLSGVINAINSASTANSAKLDELINQTPDTVSYDGPGTLTFSQIHSSFYTSLNASPIVSAFSGVATSFDTSNAACPVLSIDLTDTLINQVVSSDLICVVFEDIATYLSAVVIAVYTLYGFRILASA